MSVRLVRLLSVALFGACLSTVALAKTQHAANKPAQGSSSLVWRGDDATANAVMSEVSAAWTKAGHGRVELQPFNTASGIDAVSNGTADLAGSARPSDGSPQNARLTFTPVAWNGLVIITQASNPISNLTLKQVHDIYYGKIHNWSEVGGRNAPIDVYAVASPGDGIEYSLRSLLFGRGNQPVAAPRLYVNTRKLEEGIALNPNGLGVAMLAGISGNSKLKAIPINGRAATPANIANGSYPLFVPLYLVTNPAGPKAAQAQAFIDFLQTEPAKAALRRHDVLPYQDGMQLAAMDDARRSTILAEVGAHVNHIPRPGNAGERSQASLAAVNTVAAAQLRTTTGHASRPAEERQSGLDHVEGSVANVSVSSLGHARGSATTVNTAQTSGTAFRGVRADASQTTTQAGGKTYTVSRGDTLSLIAKRHAVEVAQLREWNHLKSDQIRLGQVLRVSNQ
ncbi:peptidoglycan-binding protein [Rhodanobacter sp. B05]|uniref:LysM peptidoglycan-binding domain-containing protein n=1 Tax=Rhodanobacter sp. B05 TaxID=1945859 RepID=UPI0009866A1E|nr:substrate-binding domain-containing protein [Rhodanobacter sp. B05]OOG57821.1 peptidoglycan-binding protein [Rhodanobacter sp. B05]